MSKSAPRNIVITGVSRGLGRAMVERLAEQGHLICGCSRSKEAIAELRWQFGPPHIFHNVDISQDRQVRPWAATALAANFVPDLLLNNAAVIAPNAPLWKVSDEDFAAVVDVNIKGVANVIRHFVPPMIARGQGVIVNFSSGWGRSTSPEVAAYCASKWAVEGLSFALAQELPEGMACVPFNPGIINTDMLKSCFGANAQRYPDAREWSARAVPFLLGLTAENNGQALSAPE
jgi:NAD(P)-dependent dehydrogenase (short-subunit alcohol dehydrogenase family)